MRAVIDGITFVVIVEYLYYSWTRIMYWMARDPVCSMHVEENTPFVLTGNQRNMLTPQRDFLKNIENTVRSGDTIIGQISLFHDTPMSLKNADAPMTSVSSKSTLIILGTYCAC